MRVTGRERILAAGFTAVVVALRAWFARQVSFCGTPDSCYALGMAQTLAAKHAFRIPFLFDLQLHTLRVPNTGLEYWRPGVSFLLLLLKPFGATTLHGSLVVAALAGVVWALAAWQIAMRATGSHRIALSAYALCLLLPPGWQSSLTPDPTLFYAAAVAWFLALFTVRRQGLAQDIGALVCVGVAYTIRNDAGLLLVPLVVVLWLRRRRAVAARLRGELTQRGSSPAYAAAMLGGFFAALLPMHLVYLHVLGTAFPAGASQALFLNDLSDFSKYGAPVSLHTMLALGARRLIAMRIGAAAFIVYRVLALVLGYTALIFLPTLALRRQDREKNASLPSAERLPELAGSIAFACTILAVYSLVLPAIGVFSALRTSTALLPVVSVAVIVAIVRVARTRRMAIALAGAVLAAYALSGVMDDRRAIEPMNAVGAVDRAEAEVLAALGAKPGEGALVMTPDPVQFSVTTGYRTAPLPGNGLDAIQKESRDLQATYAILDGEHLPGNLDTVRQALQATLIKNVPGQPMLVLRLSPEPRTQ